MVTNNGFYEYGDKRPASSNSTARRWRRLAASLTWTSPPARTWATSCSATGWDEQAFCFWALVKGKWQRYRLPKASHAFEQAWQTEWMRIREVETEHFMMDIQGMFYELQPIAFEDHIWGVKPVCQHLRTIPDYCTFRGLFAVGGNETTPNGDNNAVAGQPQSASGSARPTTSGVGQASRLGRPLAQACGSRGTLRASRSS